MSESIRVRAIQAVYDELCSIAELSGGAVVNMPGEDIVSIHSDVPLFQVVDAVIAAMQEPTEAMIRAGVGRQVNHDWHESTERDLAQMRDCWYNMLHAAQRPTNA